MNVIQHNVLYQQSGSWYKFNDEDIVKMQGKLKLSQDEDTTGFVSSCS